MKYLEYRKRLKILQLSSLKLTKIIGIASSTPPSVWKKKGTIPVVVERFLELLEKMPEEERVLFIHHKLKEGDSEKNQNQKN